MSGVHSELLEQSVATVFYDVREAHDLAVRLCHEKETGHAEPHQRFLRLELVVEVKQRSQRRVGVSFNGLDACRVGGRSQPDDQRIRHVLCAPSRHGGGPGR